MDAGHSVLAAGLADFSQVHVHTTLSVDATAGPVRGADQPQQSLVFDRTI